MTWILAYTCGHGMWCRHLSETCVSTNPLLKTWTFACMWSIQMSLLGVAPAIMWMYRHTGKLLAQCIAYEKNYMQKHMHTYAHTRRTTTLTYDQESWHVLRTTHNTCTDKRLYAAKAHNSITATHACHHANTNTYKRGSAGKSQGAPHVYMPQSQGAPHVYMPHTFELPPVSVLILLRNRFKNFLFFLLQWKTGFSGFEAIILKP
jgi:hypothetical protein